MVNASDIREHMHVVGSDGGHVGTVDKVEGDRVKLTRNDPAAGGQHHYIMLSSVDSMEGDLLRLSHSARDARQKWQSEDGHMGQMQQTGEVF